METKKLLEAERDSEESDVEDCGHHESAKEYKARWRSIRVIYLAVLLSAMEFSITLPSLWPYLQKIDPTVTPQFLAWTNGGFSLCQVAGSFLFGAWCQYRPAIEPLVACALIRIVGNFLYLLPEKYNGFHGKMLILSAKLIIGLSTGDKAVCRAIIPQSTTTSERRNAFAVITFLMLAGYAIGTALQSVAVPIIGEKGHSSLLNIDIYNVAGWIGIIIEIFILLLFLLFLKEYNIEINKSSKAGQLPKPDMGALIVTVAACSFLFYAFSLVETVSTPLMQAEFGWNKAQAVFYAGMVLSGSGIFALIALLIVRYAMRKFQERLILLLGFVLLMLSFFIALPWGSEIPMLQREEVFQVGNATKTVLSSGCSIKYSWCKSTPKIYLSQYLVVSFVYNMGICIAILVAASLYSKVIGPRKQGLFMAFLSAFGSLARFLGPVSMVPLFFNYGPRWLFVTLTLITATFVALIAGFYKRLVPLTVSWDSKREEDGKECKEK
ncbi:major facilitator superfamily domain-containing protein 8-like isoform X1 [Rhopilema esculentum]|uniref:major facilitator superfamily domain-containing protein 8-like isoform X1 n=1 Tax=Rhopilema esculentum TaxID=499914 RepID=UPI0031E07E75